jgi:hypothetical protein
MSTILGLQTVPRILRYSFRVTTETPETQAETILGEKLDRVVAFCDRWEPVLERAEKFLHNPVAAYLKSPARPRVPGKKQP